MREQDNIEYYKSLEDFRLLVEKEECYVCPQARKAVSVFNTITENEPIVIAREGDRLYKEVQQITDEVFETPLLIFDGFWIEGAFDWESHLSMLKKLDNMEV